MEIHSTSAAAMLAFGERLGRACRGGEVIELVGDIGAGKTTLTKGIAVGMGIEDEVQSPTFTLSRTYRTLRGGTLAHYDFYRLADPGILSAELHEAVHAQDTTVVIEWADTVRHVLPADRLKVMITIGDTENSRRLALRAGGPRSEQVMEALR